ncbi:translation initiation factor IF-2-like [Sceloporus undulatus]|uniref:translation initiation factor IF-2-like n=1 Tax=Sceloporus undulatus TaxID=8520 RepID=UPI001C4B6BFC|nr:translation initiation factor IF-2-like [Sceloporus undulatus]
MEGWIHPILGREGGREKPLWSPQRLRRTIQEGRKSHPTREPRSLEGCIHTGDTIRVEAAGAPVSQKALKAGSNRNRVSEADAAKAGGDGGAKRRQLGALLWLRKPPSSPPPPPPPFPSERAEDGVPPFPPLPSHSRASPLRLLGRLSGGAPTSARPSPPRGAWKAKAKRRREPGPGKGRGQAPGQPLGLWPGLRRSARPSWGASACPYLHQPPAGRHLGSAAAAPQSFAAAAMMLMMMMAMMMAEPALPGGPRKRPRRREGPGGASAAAAGGGGGGGREMSSILHHRSWIFHALLQHQQKSLGNQAIVTLPVQCTLLRRNTTQQSQESVEIPCKPWIQHSALVQRWKHCFV